MMVGKKLSVLMSKTAEIREQSSKEIIAAKRLTVVHKQRPRDAPLTPEEKRKAWVMPPLRERYIKQKKHDPL
jgi:hypothetical protein